VVQSSQVQVAPVSGKRTWYDPLPEKGHGPRIGVVEPVAPGYQDQEQVPEGRAATTKKLDAVGTQLFKSGDKNSCVTIHGVYS
jgi:hypothetical protein